MVRHQPIRLALAVALFPSLAASLTVAPLVCQTTGGLGRSDTPNEPELVPSLTTDNYEAWRDHIRSDPAERDWAKLPWLMSFREGLVAAAKAEKPLLLWTMNGHPFGCT